MTRRRKGLQMGIKSFRGDEFVHHLVTEIQLRLPTAIKVKLMTGVVQKERGLFRCCILG